MTEDKSLLWELEEIERQIGALSARRKEIYAAVKKDKDFEVEKARNGKGADGYGFPQFKG